MGFTQREARTIIRKAVGRVPAGEAIRHLNIMPMMDMMTVLLVAFIFQIATSSTALNAATVALPRTLSADELSEDTATLIITTSNIVVEGKAIPNLNVINGDVDASEKEGGANGVKIPKLTTFLAALHQGQLAKASPADLANPPVPELLIIADRTTPYGLLLEVMYSAKQKEAGYKRFRMIVQKQFPVTPSGN
jgi:biopolymer transport protein ExbD